MTEPIHLDPYAYIAYDENEETLNLSDLPPEIKLVVNVVRRAVVDYYSYGPDTAPHRQSAKRWFLACSEEPWGWAWCSEILQPDDAMGMRLRVLAYANAERQSRYIAYYDGRRIKSLTTETVPDKVGT